MKSRAVGMKKALAASVAISIGLIPLPAVSGVYEKSTSGPLKVEYANDTSYEWLFIGGVGLAALAAIASSTGKSKPTSEDPDDDPMPGEPEQPDQPGQPIITPTPSDDPARASFENTEYYANYGLSVINASARYADSASGQNVLLSVFDSGADVNHSELKGNVLTEFSHSYFTESTDVTDYNGHGTHVASIIAANKDGRGMHGVAYDADLMILQGVYREDGDRTAGGIMFDWIDGQQRSLAAGAIAINHSWAFVNNLGVSRTIDEFKTQAEFNNFISKAQQKVFAEIAQKGLIGVYATGNDGKANVSINAGLPIYTSGLDGHWIAVTAIDHTRTIADYANRCGIARDFCLAAPGSAILGAASSDSGHADNSYVRYDGTSMAAPHVTGAIGLLASNFPELTSSEITKILFETAEDAGELGTDDIYGRGILDLENAVAPQGTLRIIDGTTLSASSTRLDQSGISASGGIAGSLASAFAGQSMMVADRYDRGYSASLSAIVESAVDTSKMQVKTAAFAQDALDANGFGRSGDRQGLSFGATAADLSAKIGFVDEAALATPYSELVEGQALRFSHDIGDYSISFTGTQGDAGGSYLSTQLRRDFASHSFDLEVGTLRESGSLLGANVSGGFGEDIASMTQFARLGGSFSISQKSDLLVSASYGSSDFASSGILKSGRDIASSQIGLGVARSDFIASGDALTIGLSKPLSMTSGEINLDMPVAMAATEDGHRSSAVLRETQTVSFDDSSNTTDVQIGYSKPAFGGKLAVGGLWRTNSGLDDAMSVSTGFSIDF